MASTTQQTEYRRELRRNKAGRDRKRRVRRDGTTPAFPIHTPEADANAQPFCWRTAADATSLLSISAPRRAGAQGRPVAPLGELNVRRRPSLVHSRGELGQPADEAFLGALDFASTS